MLRLSKQKIKQIESISEKIIIGPIELVSIINNEKKQKYKARIDTGAKNTSIDIKIAEDLGFKDVKTLIKEVNKSKFNSKKSADSHIKKISKEIKQQYPFVQKLDTVKSTHGVSIRPIVKIKLLIRDLEINCSANIYDRSKMDYPILIGRNSLKKFLIFI